MASRSNPVYCAVDTVDLARASQLIRALTGGGAGSLVGGIKLGLEFFLAHGAPGVRQVFPASLREAGVGFFLDLKLHDIPNTVAGGIRAVAELEPSFITIHAAGGAAMMKAAAEAAAQEAKRRAIKRPRLLGVTVLTSLDKADLVASGVTSDPAEQVLRLAALARASGLDGVVCSPLEIAALSKQCGPDFVLMVPGIRPAGARAADQKRVMTPKEAVAMGAHHLVIGRPITEAADAAGAARTIAQDLGVL
jgi:orotidine-5'-phosphate decarboxylase